MKVPDRRQADFFSLCHRTLRGSLSCSCPLIAALTSRSSFKHKLSKMRTLWHPFCPAERGGLSMVSLPLSRTHLPLRSRAFYRRVLDKLTQAKVPFLVGGAFALEHYTGIWRYTKDLDIFMRRRHIQSALKLLGRAGFQVELTFPHWL